MLVESSDFLIPLQKDWLVVIYGKSPDKLAKINSAFRALDLGQAKIYHCFMNIDVSSVKYLKNAGILTGTRGIMPVIAGLTLSHLPYPVVAWIQVQATNKRAQY